MWGAGDALKGGRGPTERPYPSLPGGPASRAAHSYSYRAFVCPTRLLVVSQQPGPTQALTQTIGRRGEAKGKERVPGRGMQKGEVEKQIWLLT